ncbi:MAG: tetraacyldisaccharide 4'-kinase [Acidobacteriota bacterium]|nr:tetraacyldisaccharide 4'-kinase [Acidobacteriota bacterium]
MIKLAELIYRGINRARRALYRAGILKPKRLPVPVISVGGIAAGGSGKTPAAIAIARALSDRGLRVAVLTRGYGRAGEGGVVTALDPDRFGDEPVLIKKTLPGVNVIVGTNRYDNAIRIEADVFLLDDGFQHLQLHRDFDVVIDHDSGFLREGRGALRHADLVLPRKLQARIPDKLRGKKVFAFAGLADNAQFFRLFDLAGSKGFPDHHRYTRSDIDAIKRDANGHAIVTTEKDAVKIGDADVIAIPAEFMIDPADLERIIAAARR